ncbi:MAG: HAD family hydrolase [Gemmatimonadota bacterium]
MSLRLAVFDMVGTTVEAGDEVPRSFREAFRRFGVELPDEAVKGVRGRSKEEAIATLIGAYLPREEDPRKTAREVYADFKELVRSNYGSKPTPVAGATEVLEWLRKAGVKVVLTTGLDRETANQIVRGLGWESLRLSGLVAGDDVQHGRPAPDLIHTSMRRVGENDPKAVLTAGDTVSDLLAAVAAGVGWNVGVLTGAHSRESMEARPHSVILESLGDLPHWLEEVGALVVP